MDLILAEFNQIQVRESEIKELELLMENVPCAVKVGSLRFPTNTSEF
jgi:hypothetical protein